MGIDDRLDSYYQERTLDIIKRKTFMAKIGDTKEPAGWHTKAKQAIYKDLMELLDDKQLSNFQIDIVREKIRAYCE